MLVSQFIYASYGVGDPARLSAQVISGIGFLGAGTIIVTRRNQVKGLTTAATLWATACMGLAVGVGFYECALIMYVILIFILLLVNVVDTKFLKVPTSTALYLEVEREAWATPSTLSMRLAGRCEKSRNFLPGAPMCWLCVWTWSPTKPCGGIFPAWSF